MKKLLICLFCAALLLPAPAFAQRRTVIKLAALVPENTPWGAVLNRMASDWYEVTNGEVELVIYYNVKSNEADVLRQLNLNQIQAAMLSTFGLKLIRPEIMTLSCPFLIRNNEELDLALNAVRPEIERGINGRGYFTLAWSKVGWVRFFSKSPVFVPDDLKRQKLGTSETEPELMDAFRAMGYQMVPVALNQILVDLSGGKIDAVYQSPVTAGSLQIFGRAKNMASIQVAPFMGAIIMNQRAWRSVPDRYKDKLIEIAKKVEAELDQSVPAFEASLLRDYMDYGLVVNEVSPEQAQLWYADVNRIMPSLVNSIFDKNMYDRIDALLRTHRGGR
ncbi:MAG: TRAP transporter substrate-binding protein DctP [Treponema sp.]|jgi:TRAP-type C4-dicarboxylate transport system substrate-binding protein|nr:TRAP transporter substrate-binding protein DctP [Treponema sp.]